MRRLFIGLLLLAPIGLLGQTATTFTAGGSWNGGTWSNGTPNPGSTNFNATINSNVAVNCNCTVGNLTLNANLTVNAGQILTIGAPGVLGTFTTSASRTITVQSGGQLIIYGNFVSGGGLQLFVNGSMTVNGNFTLLGSDQVDASGGPGTITVTGITTAPGGAQIQNGGTFNSSGGCTPAGSAFCTAGNNTVTITPCNFTRRRRIQIDHTKVAGGADLTNFPVLINISSDNDLRTTGNGGAMQNANGFDSYFTGADGVTALNFQLQNYTAATGQYVAWVKVPLLSASVDTYIYLYYGLAGVGTNPSTTGTWNANFNGVWHLEETPSNAAGQIKDATANTASNNGTSFNTPTSVAGIAGNAVNFNGTTQYIRSGSALVMPTIQNVMTLSAWGFYASNPVGNQNLLGLTNSTAPPGGVPNGARKLGFQNKPSTSEWTGTSLANTASFSTTNAWHQYTYSWDGTTHRLYIDGAQVGSSVTASAQTGTVYWLGIADYISGGASGGERFAGRIDEVRVSNIALTAGWIQTEYNNISAPSTFYSVSSAPIVWTGATNGNWNLGTNWSTGSAPGAASDVILTSAGTQPISFNVSNNFGSIQVQSGTLSINNPRVMTINNDLLNCGTVTGTGGIVMGGSNQQVQSISGPGSFTINDLTINNTFATSPQVTLSSALLTVSNSLTLTSGLFNTATANVLSLTAAATSTSGSATSYVNGPMTKAVSAAGSFTFPVGKGGLWRRVTTGTVSTASTFRGEYFATRYSSITPVNAPLTRVSALEYWQLDQTVGTGTAVVTLFWENAGTSFINDCPTLTMGNWSGTQWNQVASSTTGVCTGAGTGTLISSAAVASANFNRPFTFASTSATLNPLPITLLSFSAKMNPGGEVLIAWITETELNNDYFNVERSDSGTEFYPIAKVKGGGTTSVQRSYSYLDTHPVLDRAYYRLRQTDFNGTSSFSQIIKVEPWTDQVFSFQVIPNPSPQGKVQIRLVGVNQGDIISLQMIALDGREIFSIQAQNVGVEAGYPTVEIGLGQQPPGLYTLRVISSKGVAYQKFVLSN